MVGPTKAKPRRFSSFESATDSGVESGISPRPVTRRARAGGAKLQTSSESPPSISSAATAFPIVASILPRCLTMPASPSSRWISGSSYAATRRMEKPSKAARNASRLRRIVIQASPA